MANKKVGCPHCNTEFEFSLDDLTQDDIKPLVSKFELAGEDHRHKTADELLDCPGCRPWFDRTAAKYSISVKEPEPVTTPEPAEKPPTRPPIGSIFKEEGD